MQFLIADTFTDSLAKLSGDEQKVVKTSAFDLQLSPANPGMSFHRIDRAKDLDFWSVRVSRDVRLIVHGTAATLNSDASRPFPKPKSGRIAVKVSNHLGDEVMKVFWVWAKDAAI